MSNKESIITRTFDADIDKVWKAWIDPDMLKKWWGPTDFTAPEIQIDFKAGGKYLYCMRGKTAPDAPERDFWSGGVFQVIEDKKTIVCTSYFTDPAGNKVMPSYYDFEENFPSEMLITTSFEEEDDGTKLTLITSGIEKMNDMDKLNMEMGWNESFDKLEKLIE